jgi:hypothetical protein
MEESYVFRHLHQEPRLANYSLRPAVHWFTYAELCSLGRYSGFAQFYSMLDLMMPDDPTVARKWWRRVLLRPLQHNAWLRALALTQIGHAIAMLKRRRERRCVSCPRFMRSIFLVPALLLTAACSNRGAAPDDPGKRQGSAEEAQKFLADANETMKRLGVQVGRVGWTYSTYITPNTEALNARANQEYIEAIVRSAKEAARFDQVQLAPDARRQMNLLKLALVAVTPSDAKEAGELTRLGASMESACGRGEWCLGVGAATALPREGRAAAPPAADADPCLDVEAITQITAENRDAQRLREVWEGWHTISSPMKKDYARFVEIANKGARELGFGDTGAMWRSKYDMPPDDFTPELDRLCERYLNLSVITFSSRMNRSLS